MAGPDHLGKALGDWQSLKFICECGHKAAWSKRRAVAVFGEGATPYSIRRSIICSKCGSKKCDVGV